MSLGINNPTLMDILKVRQPNGGIATNIVRRLSQRLPIIGDAVAKEGNEKTGHTFVAETSLPAVGWKRFNDGTPSSKGTDDQFTETCGLLKGFSKVDADLADMNGDAAAYRMSQDGKFVNALKIEASRALMYASTRVNNEQIYGLTPRFNSTTGLTANQITLLNAAPYGTNGAGIAAAGGDYASIWFVAWGDDRAYVICPQGGKVGIGTRDHGIQVLEDTNGKMNSWYIMEWMWYLGLCIEDQRQVARLCNIDMSAVTADTNGGRNALIEGMIDTYYKIYDETDSRIILYTNRLMAAILHKCAMSKAYAQLTLDKYAGQPVTMFLGHPIRTLDTLTTAEALVV